MKAPEGVIHGFTHRFTFILSPCIQKLDQSRLKLPCKFITHPGPD